MKNVQFIFLSFFIIVCACSCYSPRYVYSPAAQNIPLLHNKNDLEFAASYSGSANVGSNNYNHGIDFNTAWAITDHFAATLNESLLWGKNNTNDTYFYGDTSSLSYKRNFTEIGFGYFNSPPDNKKMQLQIFTGAALGTSSITDEYNSGGTNYNKYHISNATKIFIQPAIIYTPVKNFSGALSSRFTEVIFTHIRTNYTGTELDNYILDSLTVSPVFFWEPAVSYTFGFKKVPVKLRIQGSISVLLNHRFIEHRTGNISIGIIGDFSKKRIRKRVIKQ